VLIGSFDRGGPGLGRDLAAWDDDSGEIVVAPIRDEEGDSFGDGPSAASSFGLVSGSGSGSVFCVGSAFCAGSAFDSGFEAACEGERGLDLFRVDDVSGGSAERVASAALPGSGSAVARSAQATAGSSLATLDRFQILGVLGEGSNATVYRAYDPVLDRAVALKVPRPGTLKTARALERFLGEAKALARLRHPGIVPVYEAGHAGGVHYIAMALIEGRSLAEVIAEGPSEPKRAAEIVRDLAGALAYAHAQGIVHRDVKPANVRVDARGQVSLMDFGIAYRPDSGEVPVPSGTLLGTPAYVAPEQANGGSPDVLPSSDQYSLGVVFYELLCGQPPFNGPPSYVLFRALHEEPESPRVHSSRIPRPLAGFCLKALAKQPEGRYADCRALADELDRWLRENAARPRRRSWLLRTG
jgi:serine/threonine protein kinase